MSGDERAMRFGYLLSEIEIKCRSTLDGQEKDIPATTMHIMEMAKEAFEIAFIVSSEALDHIEREHHD